MDDQTVRRSADEYITRILSSPLATKPLFLEHLIERLLLHHQRMVMLRGDGTVDYDALPGVKTLGQSGVTVRIAPSRLYIVHDTVPNEAQMDRPKITTLRVTPYELLTYIEKGEGLTDDFAMRSVRNDMLQMDCIEFSIIDQNDTALNLPVRLPKNPFVETLRSVLSN